MGNTYTFTNMTQSKDNTKAIDTNGDPTYRAFNTLSHTDRKAIFDDILAKNPSWLVSDAIHAHSPKNDGNKTCYTYQNGILSTCNHEEKKE